MLPSSGSRIRASEGKELIGPVLGVAGLAPPEPELTPAAMLERARELRPRLRGEQAAAEQRGTYSPQMHEAFRRAGFYRATQPRRFGGYEFDVRSFLAVVIEVARGCPGSGWCLCLAAGHHLQLAGLFPERAQAEAYGPEGEFAAPCRPLPMGTAERAGDGWRISGRWDYCSGSPYATHALLGVRLREGEASHPTGLALVPRAGWRMLDDWRDATLGMAGSGSNSIEAEAALVPKHFVIEGSPQQWPSGAHSPGVRLHGNPIYGGSLDGYGQMEIAAILVGCARAALDEYERILRTKKTAGPDPKPRYTAREYQRWLGEAVGRVDTAEEALLGAAERYREQCAEAATHGTPVSALGTARLNLLTARVIEEGWQAVELLFRTSGSSEGARNHSRMQRYFRDYAMAQTNVSPKADLATAAYAHAHFDLNKLPTI